MGTLRQQKCVPCRAGEPPLTVEEIDHLSPQVPQWSIVEPEGVKRLERAFAFRDFASALTFTNAVGKIADEEGHHPALLVEWGKVTAAWWTHAIHGLHTNDFIMASRTDALYDQAEGRKGS